MNDGGLDGTGRRSGALWLAALIVAMPGCSPSGLGPGVAHPLPDPSALEDIGRRALANHGFAAIMSKAVDAGLVVKRSAAYAQSAVPTPCGPTTTDTTSYWLTRAAIWRGVATAVEVVTAESLVILGGLALVLTMEGDHPRADCADEFVKCTDSRLGSQSGSVYGESRCRTCMRLCEGTGRWPFRTGDGKPCDYWNHR